MFSPDAIQHRNEDPVIAQATSEAAGEHAQRVSFSAAEACFRLLQHFGAPAAAHHEAYVRSLAEQLVTDELTAEGPEKLVA